MNKHYLVTISNDVYNLLGVKFLCSFFKPESKHRLTLLHIYRQGTATSSSLLEKWETPDDKITGALTVGARRAIDKSTSLLEGSRMCVEQIVTKTVAERFGKVKDILNEGSKGLYDAIILGKRASYTLQWLFERPGDEIAQSIIKDARFTTPVWVCPEVPADRSGVLVCVDGSENSYRAVDHAAFILSKQDQHRISLLHIATGASISSHEIFNRAEKILLEHKIDKERVTTISTWGLSISGAILSAADRGGYAAAAVGLTGDRNTPLKEFQFAGNTTSSLISKAEKISIWCCP